MKVLYGASGVINSYLVYFVLTHIINILLLILKIIGEIFGFGNHTIDLETEAYYNNSWAEQFGFDDAISCNSTTFNFADDTGVYFDFGDNYDAFRQYSYYTRDTNHRVCQTARLGSDCVADATILKDCCIKQSYISSLLFFSLLSCNEKYCVIILIVHLIWQLIYHHFRIFGISRLIMEFMVYQLNWQYLIERKRSHQHSDTQLLDKMKMKMTYHFVTLMISMLMVIFVLIIL